MSRIHTSSFFFLPCIFFFSIDKLLLSLYIHSRRQDKHHYLILNLEIMCRGREPILRPYILSHTPDKTYAIIQSNGILLKTKINFVVTYLHVTFFPQIFPTHKKKPISKNIMRNTLSSHTNSSYIIPEPVHMYLHFILYHAIATTNIE